MTSVLWFLSTDGGQNFKQIRCSYGNMGGVSYDYTIPSVTKEQNGYCSACGKYYGDEKGTKEITEADTVIVKLPQTPQTGDSGLTLWLTLLLGAAMAAAVMGKKKKREA